MKLENLSISVSHSFYLLFFFFLSHGSTNSLSFFPIFFLTLTLTVFLISYPILSPFISIPIIYCFSYYYCIIFYIIPVLSLILCIFYCARITSHIIPKLSFLTLVFILSYISYHLKYLPHRYLVTHMTLLTASCG
jgi:hypothetical protein